MKTRQRTYPIIPLALFFICLFGDLKSQTYIPEQPWQVDSLLVVDRQNYRFNFPDTHRPLWQSLIIKKNKRFLQKEIDYRIHENNYIDFYGTLTNGDTLRVIYKRQPSDFKRHYSLFRIDSLPAAGTDSSAGTSKDRAVRLREIKFENPFVNINSGLQTSGSIMRGVQIGTNRDLTLNSGLNIELSGQLTENVEITAALTDEATPIQPEGNTQTLEEIDKVFVRFKSPYVQGTVGDFNLHYTQSEFANLSRKLQGITVLGNYKQHYLGATIATTRGFFNRVSFIGQEGNQGPYQLTGKNGERDIIVLAGTERVWINGEKMVRGESNDYVIEYANGQIRFSNRRLVTSESRIEVDFEYFPAVQKYNRNVYSATAGSHLAGGRVKFNMRYFREADDPEQVLEEGQAVSEDEKDILKNAGDDPFLASLSGETYKGDSLASYVKRSTTIDGTSYSYFEYVGKNLGDYAVSFSFVGLGQGEYQRDRLGVYRWIGPQKGDYLAVRLLPLPSQHDLAQFDLEWNPSKHYSVKSEFAMSRLDRNILSGVDDNDNQGSALQVQAALKDLPLKIRSAGLGKLSLDLNTRYVENTFEPADRLNQPDNQRYWNLSDDAQANNEEQSIQLVGLYQPGGGLQLTANAGQLSKPDFESKRYMTFAEFENQRWFNSSARYEFVSSDQKILDSRNDWWRYSAMLQKDIWKVQPQLNFKAELRKNNSTESMSGFKFEDYGTRVQFIKWRYFDGSAEFNRRFDFIYDIENRGHLLPQATTNTRRLMLRLKNKRQTSASLEIIRRDKDYTGYFEEIKVDTLKMLLADASLQDTVWQDRSTDLAELNVSHSAWKKAVTFSMQYRISTEQAALKEKVYVDVGENRGNLRYDEDLQEYVPDVDGEYLLFILPSGKFEPVTNLQSALRFKFDPSKYWRKKRIGYQKWLAHISGESYFRVEEETKEDDLRSIYLLNLSKFQGDLTVRGSIQFNQDLYLMRHNRKLSFRLRYRYTDGSSNQYLDPNENEDRFSEEISGRADWRLNPRVRSQTGLRTKQTTRFSASNRLRNREIAGYYIVQNFSFRPKSRWEVGLETEYGSEDNTSPDYPIRLWYGSLKGRLSYSLPAKGRASAEYLYQTVNPLDNPLGLSVPYEMARGRKEGVSQNWQMRVEYTVAKNVLFTVFYSGRDEAGFKNIIHSGQAEIRAFF